MSDLVALCYHAVSEDLTAPFSVTPSRFEDQMTLLRERGYEAVTFSEAVGGPHRRRAVAVTFDDAFRSVAERALPILKALGMKATVFAPTSYVGSERPMSWPGIEVWARGPQAEQLMPMSWEELAMLRDAGWEIGSHTRTHPRLTRIADDELERELRGSREDCEREAGSRCASIAYPYGDHDERVLAAASAAGYEYGATLPAHFHQASPLRYPRVGIYNLDGGGRFRLKLSPHVRKLRSSWSWRLFERIRRG